MSRCDPPDEDEPLRSNEKKRDQSSLKSMPNVRAAVKIFRKLGAKPGVHSVIHMSAAGFQYTGDGDAAVCEDCGLDVLNWTIDMKPFNIHSQRKPNCPFVLFTRLLSFFKGNASHTSFSEEKEHF